jgi:Tol biopolymer transport system component
MMRLRLVGLLLLSQVLGGGLLDGALAQDGEPESMGVWVASVDGSEPALIAPGAFMPDWSPDGQRLAYAAFGPEGMELVASAPDGTEARPILSDPTLWPLAPRWSPDGSLIAFSGSAYPDEAPLVGVTRADGSGVVWTAPTESSYPRPMDWSPDGTRLAWAIEPGPRSQVWVADANGDNAAQLAEVPGSIAGIAWSPDGGLLAIHTENYASAERTSSVSVIGADGSGLQELATWQSGSITRENMPFLGTPAWSTDGASIAIGLVGGIVLIGTNNGSTTVLPAPGMTVYEVAWSPDNAVFALSAFRESQEFEGPGGTGTDIYLMNADGADFRVLAATPLEDLYPAWSPDGASVAFHAEPAGE